MERKSIARPVYARKGMWTVFFPFLRFAGLYAFCACDCTSLAEGKSVLSLSLYLSFVDTHNGNMRDSNFRVKARRKTRNDRIAFPVRGCAGWIITITLVAVITNFATGEKVYG